MEKFVEIVKQLEGLIYVSIPFLYGVAYTLFIKIRNKKKEVEETDKAKAKKKYNIWEHEESQTVIRRIKDLCNFYKDKGSMGLVQYLQLENGTVAKSKIQNMFVTCLAEDDRFGTVHKLISKLQRVPYSRMTGWLNKILDSRGTPVKHFVTSDLTKAEYNLSEIVDAPEVKSLVVAPVYDPNEILLGICVFYYTEVNLNNSIKKESDLVDEFRTAIQSVLLEYHMHRQEKRKELNLKEADFDD